MQGGELRIAVRMLITQDRRFLQIQIVNTTHMLNLDKTVAIV